MANDLAYYNAAIITAVKSFIVEVLVILVVTSIEGDTCLTVFAALPPFSSSWASAIKLFRNVIKPVPW